MVNGVKGGAISNAYTNNVAKNGMKDATKNMSSVKNAASQSKAETLKERIEAGEYKIDLDQVAKKMAEELLS